MTYRIMIWVIMVVSLAFGWCEGLQEGHKAQGNQGDGVIVGHGESFGWCESDRVQGKG